MLFSRRTEPVKVLNEIHQGQIHVNRQDDITKQIQIIDLTPEDLRVTKSLRPFIDQNIQKIVNDFYKNLEVEPKLLDIINQHSSIDRLKTTLRRHIAEMFNGVVDESYIQTRLRVAHVHVKIGLPTKWYLGAFQNIMNSVIHIIQENVEDKDERILAMRAVTKIFSLEQQLVIEAYDRERDDIRTKEEQQRLQIVERVSEATENLAAISEEANASFQELVAQSTEIVNYAKKGTEITTTTATEADNGKNKLTNQVTNMQNIDCSVNTISEDIQNLFETAKRMQDIIDIVKSIADKTKLLSINANIQAAHVGQQGTGFVVVAQEIGKLSEQTKVSVKNVTDLITNINDKINGLQSRLTSITEAIENGNKGMDEIRNDFERILENMRKTKNYNDNIELELQQFSNAIYELQGVFEEVANQADSLSTISRM